MSRSVTVSTEGAAGVGTIGEMVLTVVPLRRDATLAVSSDKGVEGVVTASDAVAAPELERSARAPSLKRLGLKTLVRGSKASRTASENKLADSTKVNINRKAVSKLHQIIGSRDISRRAFSIIEPNEFMLGSTPIPK